MTASACEVSLRTLVLSEITQVTSLMRKNARWSGQSGTGNHAGGSSSSRSGTPNPNNPSYVTATSNSSASGSTLRTSSLASTSAAFSSNTPSPSAELSTSSDRESSKVRGQKSRERLQGGVGLVASSKGKEPGHNMAMSRPSIKQPFPLPGDLLSGFALLRDELKGVEDPRELDALLLLSPFLDVVRSVDTPGAITALALSAVDRFITYGVVYRESPNLVLAMTAVAGAGTHCKFEASDSTSDEVVLLKILDVLKNTLTSDLGAGLSDEAVCEMMETGLGMCCQMRLSEMLRKSSERSMQTMLAAIFARLRDVPNLDDTGDAAPMSSGYLAASPSGTTTPKLYPNGDEQSLRMTLPDPTSADIPAASTPATDVLSTAASRRLSYMAASREVQAMSESPYSGQDFAENDFTLDVKPYGLPSIREILRVLISLLNPHDQQNTDSMRGTALNLVNVAFEVGGASIARCAELRGVVADDLCKYLFQLARSENTALLASSLRVITNIFDTMRQHLKLQQELFLSFLMDRLIRPVNMAAGTARKGELESELDASTWNMAEAAAPSLGKSVSSPLAVSSSRRGSGSLHQSTMHSTRQINNGLPYSEGRHLMLEYLAQFAKADDFMTNLWINYDCNVDCEDLFERVVKFFSRGVYSSNPNSHTPDHSQYVCLDTLLECVNTLYSRLSATVSSPATAGSADAASLQSAKASKRNLLDGALRFNEKPKDGLAFLEAKGLIFTNENADSPRARALAQFLKSCPRLDKRLLGDFLSRPDNIEVLKEFMNLFDFRDKVISEAMREMLETFRLPGEAQQIDRITETFSHAYIAVNKNEVKTADAAYVLAFSIIMLNTDLHSPQIRKRMTYEDYCRNLKGVNDKEDFPPEYLRAIYDGIRKREMVMPEEHTGILGFEYAWKELLRRASSAGPYVTCTSSQFDNATFTLSWRPIISALSYAFRHFTDEFVLQRTIAGFQQCASLANRFDLPEVFDFIIHSLSKITGLCGSQTESEATTTYPTIDVDGQTVTVSALALRFGKSSKAQLAAIVLFAIANDNAECIDQSWADLFEIYVTFFTYSLLPQSLLNMEEFLAGTPAIPLKVRAPQAPVEEKRRNDGGLLSTLSSYLLSPYANGQEGIGRDINDDDVESTLTTIDCIASCRVDQLYSRILSLPPKALRSAITSLVDLAERATLDKIRHRPMPGLASEPPSPVTGRTQVAYDATTVFLLELLMSIAGEAEQEARQLWPVVLDFVVKLLANATSFHHILLQRAVAGMLRLAALIAKHTDLRDQVFYSLDALHTLPSVMLHGMSDQIATGLARILQENPHIAQSMTEWNLIFGLWSATASKEASAAVTFEIIIQLSAGHLGQGLNSDNFVGFVRVLNDFATIAGHGDLHFRNSPDGANDPVVLRGKHSLGMIRDAQSLANTLIAQSSLNAAAAWEAYWLPVLSVYSQQSVNGCREIRQIALANLQRTLIANEVLSNAEVDLTMVFERLIFPMLDELLKPQVFRRDPEGMGETRLRATALLCRIFLHYLIQLSERQGMAGMTDLWMKILGYLDRFMHSGRRDQMYEAVPESLKNVLLVMHASGFLLPPHQMPRSEDQARLWEATFARLDIFLPVLRQDLFPTPVAAARTSQLALQPAPARSPSPTPPIRADGRSYLDGDATPSQSMSVYL